MQKKQIPFIKTGDFARLCNTNKRTLFYYDEIGLFSPAIRMKKAAVITARASAMFFSPLPASVKSACP